MLMFIVTSTWLRRMLTRSLRYHLNLRMVPLLILWYRLSRLLILLRRDGRGIKWPRNIGSLFSCFRLLRCTCLPLPSLRSKVRTWELTLLMTWQFLLQIKRVLGMPWHTRLFLTGWRLLFCRPSFVRRLVRCGHSTRRTLSYRASQAIGHLWWSLVRVLRRGRKFSRLTFVIWLRFFRVLRSLPNRLNFTRHVPGRWLIQRWSYQSRPRVFSLLTRRTTKIIILQMNASFHRCKLLCTKTWLARKNWTPSTKQSCREWLWYVRIVRRSYRTRLSHCFLSWCRSKTSLQGSAITRGTNHRYSKENEMPRFCPGKFLPGTRKWLRQKQKLFLKHRQGRCTGLPQELYLSTLDC